MNYPDDLGERINPIRCTADRIVREIMAEDEVKQTNGANEQTSEESRTAAEETVQAEDAVKETAEEAAGDSAEENAGEVNEEVAGDTKEEKAAFEAAYGRYYNSEPIAMEYGYFIDDMKSIAGKKLPEDLPSPPRHKG